MDRLLRILIVEDSVDDTELLIHQIRRSGYQVVYERVDTPAAMRAQLACAPWDIVIADQFMPHFRAAEALALLQTINPEVPFLVVTGQWSEDEASTIMRAGARDFIRKENLSRLTPAIERELLETETRQARRQAEEARRQSDTRYRDLFENAPISLWEADFSAVKWRLEALLRQTPTPLDAYFTTHADEVAACLALVKINDVNTTTLKLFHAQDKAQFREFWSQWVAPMARTSFQNLLVNLAQDQTEFEWESTSLTATGESIDINFRWSAAPGYETSLGKVLISIVDITGRKRAEEAARKSAAELQAVFDAFPDLFFRLDHASTILNSYAGHQTQLEVAPQALVGRRLTEALPPDAAAPLQEAVLQASRTGQVVTIEYPLPSPQGTQIFEARLVPFPDQQIIAILRNITEHKRVLAQMFNSQKLVDLGTLAAGVAHELNSPLQVITGLSESLLNRTQQGDLDPQRFGQNLDTINRSGWRCAEIVRSLLTYARASTSQMQPHDLNSLVRDTLLLIEHQLRNWSNIAVLTELAPELPPLPCDRNQITQILINLLTNARDAMPDGGEITIRTGHRAAPASLMLQVSDIGPGIPAAHRARIFEPFFTTKPAGKGTGLGLYIVAGIVRAYGGEIQVDSPVGAGTTFTLLFPAQTEQPAAAPDAPPAAERAL
jgi:two-component system, cell cycle sensor histidine kinase and response regulator CckA